MNTALGSPDHYRVLVFDFDGTLVDSNQPKFDAFFTVGEEFGIDAVFTEEMLAVHREASRYDIARRILETSGGGEATDLAVEAFAARYGELVLEVAKDCAEMPMASATLELLNLRFPLYLSSTTPEEPLREIIRHRGWQPFFEGVYGYPRRKGETLRDICQQRQMDASVALVIGDGQSDRDAAQQCGAGFFPIDGDDALANLVAWIAE